MKQDLKKRLRAREPLFGCWTSIGHPSITEIFARTGADFIGIDLEHSTISQEQAQRIISASRASPGFSFPRGVPHSPISGLRRGMGLSFRTLPASIR